MSDQDELVSQFLMFTGSEDTEKAASYLEMSAGNLERAVSLFMDHTQSGGGGGGGNALLGGGDGGFGMADDVRAPDATQTMRLMDDGPSAMLGHHPYLQMDPMLEEQLQRSAFANPSAFNARDAVNAAAAADPPEEGKDDMQEDDDEDYEYDDDDDEDADEEGPKTTMASLANMFAAPEHLIYKEGGFEGARNMAKDNKRWLLVNIQKDSEFACHALNRDVWRDELVENLIREGFIFWQTVSVPSIGYWLLVVSSFKVMLMVGFFDPDGHIAGRAGVRPAVSRVRLSPYRYHRSPNSASHVEEGGLDTREPNDRRVVRGDDDGLLLSSFVRQASTSASSI